MTDLRHDYVQTHYTPLAGAVLGELTPMFDELVGLGRDRLAGEGVDERAMSFERSLDLRYVGQEFALPIPIGADELDDSRLPAVRARFNAAHEHRYGYATPNEEVEMVNLRVVARGARERPGMPAADSASRDQMTGRRDVYFNDPTAPVDCPVYDRTRLGAGEQVGGPAVIEEHSSTTLLWEGDVATAVATGELIVEVGQG